MSVALIQIPPVPDQTQAAHKSGGGHKSKANQTAQQTNATKGSAPTFASQIFGKLLKSSSDTKSATNTNETSVQKDSEKKDMGNSKSKAKPSQKAAHKKNTTAESSSGIVNLYV